MLVVGLTGGIGSGKSTVAERFQVLGVPVIDTDIISRELVQPGQPALIEIVARFGKQILKADGALDRAQLRRIVFEDDESRKQLESILHPRIRQRVREKVKQVEKPYCIVVIPLLFESRLEDTVDRVLVVDVEPKEQLRRTCLRDDVSASQAQAIIDAQIGRDARLAKADDVVENNGELTELYAQVDALHKRYSDMAISVKKQDLINEYSVGRDSAPSAAKAVESRPAAVAQPAGDVLIYELPLNERIRTFLRLEVLFEEVLFHLRGDTVWDSRASMAVLLDIMAVFSRPELKTEMMKELDRLHVALGRFTQVEGVDNQRLTQLTQNLKDLAKELRAMEGQIGFGLKTNEFLSAVRQRESAPGGAMCFDTPALGFWLGKDAEQRTEDIKTFLKEFDQVKRGVKMILKLIRESADATSHDAANGFFQSNLDTSQPYQLIRVSVPASSPFYPEISGGRHRFTVRFLLPRGFDRPVQTDQDVPFNLAVCGL